MKKLIAAILALGMGVASAVPVFAKTERAETVEIIVELEGEPESVTAALEMPEKKAELSALQTKVLAEIAEKTREEVRPEHVYTAVLNGFSIETTEDQIAKIRALPGVKSVERVVYFHVVEPKLISSDDMIARPMVSGELGVHGEGQVIAVIDSEFDSAHEMFDMTPTAPRLTEAAMRKIDVPQNGTYKSSKIPFAYDYTTNTSETYSKKNIHGTHVAGIAGGRKVTLSNGTVFSGIAPEAQLLFMKISDQYGGMSSADLNQALDDAYKIGADCVNLSLGIAYAGVGTASMQSTKTAVENLRKAGIPVACAAGNEARGFLEETPKTDEIDYSAISLPSAFSAGTAVASVNNTSISMYEQGIFTLSDGSEASFQELWMEDQFCNTFYKKTTAIEFCEKGRASDFAGRNLDGKIAVIQKSAESDTEKVLLTDSAAWAQAAGAVGIIYLGTDDRYGFSQNRLPIPAVLVRLSDAERVKNSSTVYLRERIPMQSGYTSPRAGGVSDFSSWGVSDNLELKPEFAAPGGFIYSAVPDNQYKVMSGTSMATPHAAGVFALMNQYYQTNPFSAKYNGKTGAEKTALLENLLMSTAEIQTQENGVYVSPRHQGAGMIHLKNAMQSPAILIGDGEKSKLSLGDNLGAQFTINATVQNLTDRPLTYSSVSVKLMLDDYEEANGEYYVGESKWLESQISGTKSVTVPAGGSGEIVLTVVPDREALAAQAEIFRNGFFIDGFLELSSEAAGELHLPFTGFCGDWFEVPIFDQTIYDEGGTRLVSEDGSCVGTHLYSEEDGEVYKLGVDPETSSADRNRIALSPNGDQKGDELGIALTSMRSIGYMEFSLIDTKTNEIKTRAGIQDLSKFKSYSFEPSLPTLADGDYLVRLTGYYAEDTEKQTPHILELPLKIDTQKPSVRGVRENGKLKLFVRDNHAAKTVRVSYLTNYGGSVIKDLPLSYQNGVLQPILMDLSEVREDTLLISVYDYAGNERSVGLEDCFNPISTDLTAMYQRNDSTTAVFTAQSSGGAFDADLYLCFYRGKQLIAVKQMPNTTIDETQSVLPFDLSQGTGQADRYCLLYWDAGGMHPLTEGFTQ